MKKIIVAVVGVIFILLSMLNWKTIRNEADWSEQVKVVVREIGNQTLLANQDSSSLVFPVLKLEKDLFQLSFEREIAIIPETIPEIIRQVFKKGNISEEYRLEILQCKDEEVAYSYQIGGKVLNEIIPCRGRVLPEGCYLMQIRFLAEPNHGTSNWAIAFLIMGVILFGFAFLIKSKSEKAEHTSMKSNEQEFTAIGSFQFYPDQNKLIKQPTEISLSRKECELLEILVANANQIVKRDELSKRIWEDHGVIVGRSLDTYISKLRKKLKGDDSIKIRNIHGVGYRLEVK